MEDSVFPFSLWCAAAAHHQVDPARSGCAGFLERKRLMINVLSGLVAVSPGFANAAGAVLLAVPQPTPEAPPGSDGFLTVLNWVFWFVLLACIAGFLVSIGMLIYNAVRGNPIQGVVMLIVCIVGAILAGSAVAILNMFI
ncbi:MAG: hypothetical protein ACTH2Q_21580 [Propionibacteriaceae bacterium]